MLSLAGIPPLVGFLGKFYVFGALVKGGYYGYAALGLTGAVISTYYYLKVIVSLYFPGQGEEPVVPPKVGPVTLAVLTLMGLGTLILGLFPGPLVDLARGLGIG